MHFIKNILIISTILLCVFVSGVIFFLLITGDEVLTRVYCLLLLLLIVIGYHYKSYSYYDNKILKNGEKKLVLSIGFIALGFNMYIIYKTSISLIDYIVNVFNNGFVLDWNHLIDISIFLFGLLGVFEIAQLRSMIKRLEEKMLLKDEINEIGNIDT